MCPTGGDPLLTQWHEVDDVLSDEDTSLSSGELKQCLIWTSDEFLALEDGLYVQPLLAQANSDPR